MAEAGTNDYNRVTSTDLPAWYKQYTQNLAQTAGTLASDLNSQPLPANSVAGFNQDQQQAFKNIRDNQGNWQEQVLSAADMTGRLAPTAAKFIDYAQGAVGAPAFTSADSIQPWAQGAQDALSGDAGMVSDGAANWAANIVGSAGGPADQTASNVKQYATDADKFVSGAADKTYDNATAWSDKITTAADGDSINTASNITKYATDAKAAASGDSQEWTQKYSKYMSPYTSAVVDNIGRLGKRNWEDSIMPGVNSAMVGSGQFGSTRNADILAKAGLSANQDILGAQSNALQSGYGMAAGIFGTDANRAQQQQQLQAQTALNSGNMLQSAYAADANRTQQQQQNLINATQNAGALSMSALTNDANRAQQQGQIQASTSLAGGNMMQGAYAADANRNLQQQQNLIGATQNAGALSMGALTGDANRAQQQQQLQSSAALSGGNMMQGALSADANRVQQQGQLQANTALSGATGAMNALNTAADNSGALAQMYQTMGQTDANNLMNVGNQQQALQQRGYDTAFGNAQLARTDPWQQLNNAGGVLNNIKLPALETLSSSGQSGQPPSAWDTVGAGLAGLAGVLSK